jgi:hypothetical protein
MAEYVIADIKTVINSMEIIENENGKLVANIKLPGPNAKNNRQSKYYTVCKILQDACLRNERNGKEKDREMNKEIIEEYNRMKKERDDLYVRSLNLKIGSGFRMVRDELHAKEANIKKYMWVHGLTDDFVHDL